MKFSDVVLEEEYAVAGRSFDDPARIKILEPMTRPKGNPRRGYKGRIIDGGASRYRFGWERYETIGLYGTKWGFSNELAEQEGFIRPRDIIQTWKQHEQAERERRARQRQEQDDQKRAEAKLAELEQRLNQLGLNTRLTWAGNLYQRCSLRLPALEQLIQMAESKQ